MIKLIQYITGIALFKAWLREEKAVAALETAILFPVLVSLLMAVYDLGQGVIVNQKTIAASQIIGDLITRNENVDMDMITDIVIAGELAFQPYDSTVGNFGYDIIGVQYDDEEEPEVTWRVTNNMTAQENVLDRVDGLGAEGEGVIVVSIVFRYEPFFSNFVVDEFNMMEVAVLRGRKSAMVGCADCPSG